MGHVPAAAAKAGASKTKAKAGPLSTAPVTRARQRAISQMVEEALCSTDDPAATFNAVVHQMLGAAAAEALECSNVEDLERARIDLALMEDEAMHGGAQLEVSLAQLEANKAAVKSVVVKAKDGSTGVYHVPGNERALSKSPQRNQWVAADQKAWDVILLDPRNKMVPITKPGALGVPIAPCVTTRMIKQDKATMELAAHDAFKSRHAFDGRRWGSMSESMGHVNNEPTSSTVADDALVKCVIADAALRNRSLAKIDETNAYLKGERKRPPTYMSTPISLPMFDADGTRMCLEIGGGGMWGESPSGAEWQSTLHKGLCEDGWRPAEGVPCCYAREMEDGNDAIIITIVDDILISESSQKHEGAQLLYRQMEARYGKGDTKMELEPTTFVGITIRRDRSRRAITINMAGPIEAAARAIVPEYVEGATRKQMDLPEGKKMSKMLDELKLPAESERAPKMSPKQRATRSSLGKLKWYEKVDPALTHGVHRLSCVAAYPTPEADIIARALLCDAYDRRHVGITYGGGGLCGEPRLTGSINAEFKMADGAPNELEATADSTWSGDNVYAVLLTYGGGAVVHTAKLMHLIVDSSMESEAVATAKAGEAVTYVREILRALGVPPMGPTFVGTDNKANALLASGRSLPSRSRHCLRRYQAFLERKDRGTVDIGHVRDEENPADFMTKYVPKAKYEASYKYATNAHNSVRA